ncbi:MAG: sugar transferase [Acidimicrobiia bacterium]
MLGGQQSGELDVAAQAVSPELDDQEGVGLVERHRAQRAEPHVVIDLRTGEPLVEIRPAEIHDELPMVGAEARLLSAPQWMLAVKRLIDISVGLAALVILSPVFVLAAVAVKLSSPGPIFYVSDRVGRRGITFKFIKFRSMMVEADYEKPQLLELNELDGPVFKIRSDPRITPVGRVLRKFSVDELPQLVHVLAGDMSLVGPRPPLPEETDRYTDRQWQRLLVKPGITCTWQVSGRSEIDFATWVRMDLDYIERWSLLRDLKLMVLTIPAVLSGRGAY